MEPTLQQPLEYTNVLRRLLSQSYLFDDPLAYEAGVRDALALLDDTRTADRATPAA